MAPADFNGSWKEERIENMEGFLEALGVPAEKRSAAENKHDKSTVVQDGNNFTWTSNRGGREHSFSFIADGSQQQIPFGPKPYEGTVGWEGSTLVFVVTLDDGKTMTTRRSVEGATMITEMTLGDQTAKLFYKRV